MEKNTNVGKPSDLDSLSNENELMSLMELQKFLAEELVEVDGETSFSRAFLPLTDGLGLASPLKKEAPEPVKPVVQPTPRPAARGTAPTTEIFDTDPLPSPAAKVLVDLTAEKTEPVAKFFTEPKSEEVERLEAFVERKRQAEAEDEILPTEKLAAKSLAAAIDGPVPAPEKKPEIAAKPEEVPVQAAKAVPPPMPEATFGLRFLSGMLDEIFVLTVWLIALVITSSALTGTLDLSVGLLKQFSNPLFLRFAALEFATVWLAYLAIGLGVLDMTFGMWVWGLRVRYSVNDGDAKFLRRVARVVLSFFIFAPVFPTVLLTLRIKGRNLLDWLSGTGVYRSLL